MNRLIIVGNGFDLAHGLPTGYGHFVNWFWKNLRFTYKSESIKQLVYIDEMNYLFVENDITCFNDFLKNLKEYSKDRYDFNQNELTCHKVGNTFHPIFEFRNHFFKTICKNHSIQNWVDIENEYYRLLTKILKNLKEDEDNSKVKRLNEEFEQVKNLLEKYLIEVSSQFNLTKINNTEFLRPFEVRERKLGDDDEYLKEFPEKFHKNLIEKSEEISKFSYHQLQNAIWDGTIKEENLFINFNYTTTLDVYIRAMSQNRLGTSFGIPNQIQIHGRLNDPDNKINFGFGDEMDKHYQEIEEKDDNEYLKNIKSFQYLQNSNYKRVLDFIEGDGNIFQVYIMGHSCGLSDRILLNTIFEHSNCISIKVFYHKFDEPKLDDRTDNYTEIVQNISRHFNKKKMMRDKIINKLLCQQFPKNSGFEPITHSA